MEAPATVYIVYVWRADRPFEASARAIDDDRARHFTSPRALLRFLVTCPPESPTATRSADEADPLTRP